MVQIMTEPDIRVGNFLFHRINVSWALPTSKLSIEGCYNNEKILEPTFYGSFLKTCVNCCHINEASLLRLYLASRVFTLPLYQE